MIPFILDAQNRQIYRQKVDQGSSTVEGIEGKCEVTANRYEVYFGVMKMF